MRLAAGIIGLIALIGMGGCRQNTAAPAYRFPWESAQSPAAAANPAVASLPPDPFAPTSTDAGIARLRELIRRQDEQSELSRLQRQELERLTAQQRQTTQELGVAKQDKFKEQLQKLQEQSRLVESQQKELQQLAEVRRRVLQLDANNRELHAQLARSEQRLRIFEDESKLMRERLDESASQLAGALDAKRASDNRFRTLQASAPRRGAATITPNNSLRGNLTAVSVAGVAVRQDGDVVRMLLPGDQLFLAQTAELRPDAAAVLDQVASAIGQHYARQIVGIEAHTDNTPPQNPAWGSNHQLSAAQAMAVFDHLTQRHRFPPRQLFVLGHGPNYQLASNASPQGRKANRRVEIVIYPETIDQR